MTRLKHRLRSKNRLKEFQGKMMKFCEFPFRYLVYLKLAVPVDRDDLSQSTDVAIHFSCDVTPQQEKCLANLPAKFDQFNDQILFEMKDKLSPQTFQEFSFRVSQYEELKRFVGGYSPQKLGHNTIFSRHETSTDPKSHQRFVFLRYRFMTDNLDSLSFRLEGVDII